jgi:P4 family phage/plasmid primase-like protien
VRSVGTPRAWDPEVIDQAIPKLPQVASNSDPKRVSDEPPVELGSGPLKVWCGEKPKLKDGGGVDRSGTLVKIGRVLYDAGATRPAIVAALAERDEALGYRKYTGRDDASSRYHDIVAELQKNGRNGQAQITFGGNGRPPTPAFNLTEKGNAERLVHHHGEDLRYCWKWHEWFVFDGTRWKVDDTGEVYRRAKATVASIYQEASSATDDEQRKALAKHAMRSESGAKIREMIHLARDQVPVVPSQFDADPWLLNVENGTLNLQTGALREHRREDLITKIAPAEYDPDAAASTWTATLERALPSQELRQFFKKLCGYALTGDVSEHVLPVLYGTGANGKSTILNALLSAAGDYGMQAAPDLLVAKKGSHPTEVADLFGMRLVASIEVEDGSRLAESLVKSLTGGDKVRARRMRQDFWQFDPTHKVFMAVNHKPEVRGTDTAIWRRLRLLPFEQIIPPAEQDKQLPEKLRAELPGILAWAVEGCLEWRRDGLEAPAEVRKATGRYRSEMDIIGAFLQDECEIGADYREPFTRLYKRYEEWCEEGGERAETRRKFNARLKERGQFESRRSGPGGANEWHGLRLLKHQTSGFAGKLTQRPGKDHNYSDNPASRRKPESSFSSSVTSVEPPSSDPEVDESATVEQLQRIRKLVGDGMSEGLAREEVLGKGWVEP